MVRPGAAAMILTVANYRPFTSANPIRIDLDNGTIALLGPNNVGKSAVLRMFYELRGVFDALRQNPQLMVSGAPFDANSPAGTNQFGAAFSDLNEEPMSIKVSGMVPVTAGNEASERKLVLEVVLQRVGVKMVTLRIGGEVVAGENPSVGLRWADGAIKGALQAEDPGRRARGQPREKVPAPIADVRELITALGACADTLYIGPHRHALADGGNQHFDLPAGSQFVDLWRQFKTGDTKKDRLSAQQVEEDVRVAFGLARLDVTCTPAGALQISVNGRVDRAAEIGSGIVQFVMVLATAAKSRPALILIDEPEINLYPALQLTLLALLEKYARHGVLFTTHVVGLARWAEQALVVARGADGLATMTDLRVVPSAHVALGELSFAIRQELGTDIILLVEGPTEVRVMHHFLGFYGLADRVAIISLGGDGVIKSPGVASALAQYVGFASKVFAVIDSESAQENSPPDPERRPFIDACAGLGIDCHVLSRRATENYFTEPALSAAVQCAALGPFDALPAPPTGWKKKHNGRIASHMTKRELDETDLGVFLQRISSLPLLASARRLL